jgi:hypothetical protein
VREYETGRIELSKVDKEVSQGDGKRETRLPGEGTSWCGAFLLCEVPGEGASWCGAFLLREVQGIGGGREGEKVDEPGCRLEIRVGA